MFSAPLHWDRFYDDMSHVRPYNPAVIINYLCKVRDNATSQNISNTYKVIDLVYRYRAIDWRYSIHSKFFLVDLFLKILKIIFVKLGFRRYVKNGFTLVLKKS